MKDTRINIRIPTAEKEAWEAVAQQYGMTLTEFVTRSVRGTVLNMHSTGTASTGMGATFNVVNWASPSGKDPSS